MIPRAKGFGSKSNPVRKITITGGASYGITIPKVIVESLGWKERQKVTVKKVGNKIVIEDWKGK